MPVPVPELHSNFNVKDKQLVCQTGWLNGRPFLAKGSEPFPVYDPGSGSIWAHQEAMGTPETEEAIAAATAAFPAWAKVPPRARSRLLLALDTEIRANRDDLAQLLTMETGKSLGESLAEIDYAASYTWLMAGECERISGEVVKNGENSGLRYIITRQPIGPVGLLLPWNFPVVIGLRKIATALAAGCTMVVKPSPETPITASAMAVLCTRAGIPDGVVNVVTASTEGTPAVGKTLCEDARIKKISFTGSTPVGKLLMQQSASTLKKMTLELGGNGGFVVFEDADLEKASDALVANKFRSAGQVCMCANRVFVHSSVMDKFAGMMKDKIGKLVFGHGLDKGVTNGSLTTLRGAERAIELIEDAVKHGGRVITGGSRFGKGYHVEPTLIVGADRASRVYCEEMFAPIASLYSFETEEEVLDLVNDTPMGLTNYIFTTNLARAFRVTDALQSGTVAVNTPMANAAESPFGGVKESGFGSEGGLGHGVQEFCTVKAMALML